MTFFLPRRCWFPGLRNSQVQCDVFCTCLAASVWHSRQARVTAGPSANGRFSCSNFVWSAVEDGCAAQAAPPASARSARSVAARMVIPPQQPLAPPAPPAPSPPPVVVTIGGAGLDGSKARNFCWSSATLDITSPTIGPNIRPMRPAFIVPM